MRISVTDNVDFSKLEQAFSSNKAGLWDFAAETWYKLCEPFTPMDTGMLFTTVTAAGGEIHYNAPYSVYVENGDHMDFQKTHHPLASAHWSDAAEPTQLPKLTAALQGYVDRKVRG